MEQSLAFQITLQDGFDPTIQKVSAALKTQGFGILTRMDVTATLKEKIDVEFRPYTILGACNPHLAYRALGRESKVGLLLPCNVTVESIEDGTLVSIVNPEAMLAVGELAENEEVQKVAAEARIRLESVITTLKD